MREQFAMITVQGERQANGQYTARLFTVGHLMLGLTLNSHTTVRQTIVGLRKLADALERQANREPDLAAALRRPVAEALPERLDEPLLIVVREGYAPASPSSS